ncbi:hypothetical protein BCR33DRAFT_714821 [Rhizoclosmatium globosum]|uniref:Peptidase S28 n=1 Tax=Rhizoclosmatium globosum TaxID=329046 RepID=A0A1Y2CLA6_9FUNG|nr:hypothetical protein BCR33DRAFT_714821 [Rhizoclosmatium globosum]|eukprot:ORY47756.1 hypothetical protein BCR33DRAFT_714821 [Rhizoclosmatium globosum]
MNHLGDATYGPQYNYLIQPSNTTSGLLFLDALCDGSFLPAFTNSSSSDTDLISAIKNLTITFMQQNGFQSDADREISGWNTNSISDRSIENNWFLWYWQACNEFGYNQVAQNISVPEQLLSSWSAYSQFITMDYAEWACRTQFGIATGKANVKQTTDYYGGLDVKAPFILWINGEYDPWHWLSNYETPPDPATQRSILFFNATHCNDLWGKTSGMSVYQAEFFNQVFSVLDDWIINNPAGPSSIGIITGATAIVIFGIAKGQYSQVVTGTIPEPDSESGTKGKMESVRRNSSNILRTNEVSQV